MAKTRNRVWSGGHVRGRCIQHQPDGPDEEDREGERPDLLIFVDEANTGKPILFLWIDQTHPDLMKFETQWMVDRLMGDT